MDTIINKHLQDFLKELNEIDSLKKYEEIRNKYLAKAGIISSLLQELRNVPKDAKASVGAIINSFKQEIESKLAKIKKELDDKAYEMQVESEKIDVTLPGIKNKTGSLHPITIINNYLIDVLIPLGFQVKVGPEVETENFNFTLMNFPKNHPAREMQDSFYIDALRLLRTHTSPVQARNMVEGKGEALKILCPGKVYRRDSDDATHSHQFNQIEGLVVSKIVTVSELKGTLNFIAKALFGEERKTRLRSSYFPFTEPSVELDVSCHICNGEGCALCKETGWIEILGAGMVHPNVLRLCGYDPKKVSGFAFGLGVDRIAMLKYQINDIRELYNSDIKTINQFRSIR